MALDERFIARLGKLSESQLTAIRNIVDQLERPAEFVRSRNSDLISPCILREFGDMLRIHHCFSSQSFTKDKFEYAMERAFNMCGRAASLSSRGNPGSDVVIDDVAYSLKTQADSGIKTDVIFISKFMELGKGEWNNKPKQLVGLRERFLKHMEGYARILTLRHFEVADDHRYELVEIPKALLQESGGGAYQMMLTSRQLPKPGTFTVKDANGEVKFQLYFDGGTERKLQVRQISIALCTVHAEWRFPRGIKIAEGTALA